MRNKILTSIALCFLLVSAVFAQGGNAGLTGVATDQSGALLPGVTITVTNTDTGIVSTVLTNESGSYNFPSLQPGTKYRVVASLPGFQSQTVNNLDLGVGSINRQNFQLGVAGAATTVNVQADASAAIATAGASVGDVLTKDRIDNLPLVGQNILDLLEILPGFRINAFGTGYSTIGGLNIDSINVTRDGMTVTDTRFGAAQTSIFDRPTIDPDRPISTVYTGDIRQLSTTVLNPDLVGEIRLILSPVDAELGRGNSQVQIQTRSGTNRYSGSAVWNVRNTALNANTWGNNNDTVTENGVTRWQPTTPDWRNTHQYTISYGGPIIRNKTFFFVLWDQNISNTRTIQNNSVLTGSARNGIFRFWEGYLPDSADPANIATIPSTAADPTSTAVDEAGRPLMPLVWANGDPYTGRLTCFSIFGTVDASGAPLNPATHCPGGVDSRGNAYAGNLVTSPDAFGWDPMRLGGFNQAGYFSKLLGEMPLPNDFFDDANGDGLNYANFRWLRGRKGNNSNEGIVGSDQFTNRKQINVKIDQNFKSHRISGNWSYQMDDSADNVAAWQGGINGEAVRRPQTLTINGTSTFSPSLLNEARFGVNYNKTTSVPAWLVGNNDLRARARSFLMEGGTRDGVPYPVIPTYAEGNFDFGNGVMATNAGGASVTNLSYSNPSYTLADTVSWTKGAHAFKFGADVRMPRSNGYSLQPYSIVNSGNISNTTASPFDSDTNATINGALGCATAPTGTNPPDPNCDRNGVQRAIFTPATRDRVRDLAYNFTDSVAAGAFGGTQSYYWIDNYNDVATGTWQDVTTRENRIREMISTEYAFFVKDDFKVSRALTLNLGLRYEYYSPAYLKSGLTSTIVDQGDGLFGVGRGSSNRNFDNWLQPGNLYFAGYGSNPVGGGLRCETGTPIPGGGVSTCDPSKLTNIEFVGPSSPNPDKTVIPRDRNNFGPAIGLSWALPWFGEGKTTIRGGYQTTFQRVSVSEGSLAAALGGFAQPTLSATDPRVTAITATRAVTMLDVPSLLPVPPTAAPGQTIPVYAASASTSAYNPDYHTPYTHNLTLSVTRQLTRAMTLDVRYVGTFARETSGNFALNTSTAFYNPELLDALERTRRGENVPLFDEMLAGLRLPNVPVAYGTVNGTTSFGSEQLRLSSTTRANLANGNLAAVANSLQTGTVAVGTGTLAGGAGLQPAAPGLGVVSGVILRNGCNRLANGLTNVATRCFSEDYLVANPQLNGATYNDNLGRTNYNALQVQFSLRPVQGISFQSTYGWAKTLGLSGSGYTDPKQRQLDYGPAFGRSEPAHTFRTNGTFELPIGPNKLMFGNTSGWVARLIERWSTSIILNATSGTPNSYTGAATMLYANGRWVATENWKTPKGKVEWNANNGNSGTFFGIGNFVNVRDPQCADTSLVSQVAPTITGANPLSQACTLNALGFVVPAGTPGSSVTTGANPVSYLLALKNAKPGEYGTLGNGITESWGVYYVDANLSKTFRLTESKQLSVRVDATNILNHPQPDPPSFAVGTGTLGSIAGKNTRAPRNLQAQVRLTF
jgi:hypothetical protein